MSGQQAVGFGFNGLGHLGAGRSPRRRVVFDAAVFRRIVGRRQDQAVGYVFLPMVIKAQDRP